MGMSGGKLLQKKREELDPTKLSFVYIKEKRKKVSELSVLICSLDLFFFFFFYIINSQFIFLVKFV
jgi:hypothetical protein